MVAHLADLLFQQICQGLDKLTVCKDVFTHLKIKLLD
jgi:hypothetical protein